MKSLPRILLATVSLAVVGVLALRTGQAGQRGIGLDCLLAREVQANTYSFSAQEDPSLAIDGQGRILVTWSSRRQEVGNYGVFAQLLDPLGRPLGTEMHVNQLMGGAQQDAYAAFADDGTGWVVYSSMYRRTVLNGIFLRRFRDGDQGFGPDGDEIWVGGESEELYTDPCLAVNDRGELLVAYVRNEAEQLVVVGRLLSPEGLAIGDPFRLGELQGGQERMPDVVALPSGDFVAVWQQGTREGILRGIVARHVARDGSLGDVLTINDRTDLQHVEPSIDIDDAGQMLVAWMSTGDGEPEWQVRARRFDSDLHPLAASFSVDAGGTGQRNGATALCAQDGRFLVAYNVHGGPFEQSSGKPGRQVDIWAQVFDTEGAPLGEGYRINAAAPGAHAMQIASNGRHAIWTADQVVFSWGGKAQNDGSGVAVRILTDEGFDVPAPAAVEPLAACSGLTSADIRSEVYPDPIPASRRDMIRIPPPINLGSNGFIAHDETIWSPPDPDLAVGPDMVVSQVNMEIAGFSKDGTELWRQDNTSPGFYSSVGAGDFVFDPVSTYDWHSGRFIVANSELGSSQDFLTFAVSKDSHPDNVDDWWKFRVQVSPSCQFPDFPNLGVNREFIYITTDCFSGGGNRVMIFDKSTIMNGTLGTWWNKQMSGNLQSLGNTKNYDTTNSYQFFVSAGFGSGSSLRLQCKRTPTEAPINVDLPVSAWSSPADAPQQGSSNQLSVIDARIKHGVVRNGHLYCAHGVRSGSVTRVRWYEIDLGNWPDSGSPSLLQEGELNLGAGVYSWFPDIAPDASGNITIAYNRSASNEPGSMESVYRLVGDAPGTMRPPTRLQTNTSPYTGPRWGDYAGVDEDPAAPGTFWSHLEYSVGPWETWVGKWTIPVDPGTAFGGGGAGVPCPCGNTNDGSLLPLLAGCDNGQFPSGTNMNAMGIASVSNDTVVFTGTNVPSQAFGVFFQGNTQISPGLSLGFQPNGLLEVSGALTRFAPVQASLVGQVDTTGYTQSISSSGGVSAGDTRYYQLWYRNTGASAPCTTGSLGGSNTSNGYAITWLP